MTSLESDGELLTTMSTLGAEPEPDSQQYAHGMTANDQEEIDLRGERDRDAGATHPWRSV
ncbi:MAG: hypothetical protein ACRDTC_21510 [Pseudonocardiaceae bacterium]